MILYIPMARYSAIGRYMLSLDNPFVFFDDARPLGASHGRYYHQLYDEMTLTTADDIWAMDDMLRNALRKGYHVAGYLSYEAGLLLEARTAPLLFEKRQNNQHNPPLGWFGIFHGYDNVENVAPFLPKPCKRHHGPNNVKPKITKKQYIKSFERVQQYIHSGDIYQANLTFQCEGQFSDDALSLYARLRPHAAAGYGGIMNIPSYKQSLLSFSPELFFTLKAGEIIARPMKGTAKTHRDIVHNEAIKEVLQNDPKQRAENLMIVDLLRNDLSKICVPSSVRVPDLFQIETYPTVHQMTSSVHGKLYADKDALDVVRHIFPCGSITGAPKIRSMEVIDEVEHGIRGAYCGSMGWMDPNGDAAYNVAIRTLSMQHDSDKFSFGIGSGIVADSEAGDEWDECLAKAAFINGDQ